MGLVHKREGEAGRARGEHLSWGKKSGHTLRSQGQGIAMASLTRKQKFVKVELGKGRRQE